MIEINLAPITELENKVWYLTDLISVSIFFLIFSQSINFYIHKREIIIQVLNEQSKQIENNRKRLDPEIQKYAQLVKQIDDLNSKIQALEQITVSKLDRYMPVILLEKLQTIKSEGIWFSNVNNDSQKKEIKIHGFAIDSLYVADFMHKLDETKDQELNPKDLRTQIYFKNIQLNILSAGQSTKNINPDDKSDSKQDMNSEEPSFDLIVSYEQKRTGSNPLVIQGS